MSSCSGEVIDCVTGGAIVWGGKLGSDNWGVGAGPIGGSLDETILGGSVTVLYWGANWFLSYLGGKVLTVGVGLPSFWTIIWLCIGGTWTDVVENGTVGGCTGILVVPNGSCCVWTALVAGNGTVNDCLSNPGWTPRVCVWAMLAFGAGTVLTGTIFPLTDTWTTLPGGNPTMLPACTGLFWASCPGIILAVGTPWVKTDGCVLCNIYIKFLNYFI